MRKNILVLAGILLITALPITSLAQAPTISASLSVADTVDMSPDRIVATLLITYSCGPVPGDTYPYYVSSTGFLSQASGRDVASASFGIGPVCDGAVHTAEINVHATTIPWHGGPARVTVSLWVQDCSQYPCQSASADADVTVHIRG